MEFGAQIAWAQERLAALFANARKVLAFDQLPAYRLDVTSEAVAKGGGVACGLGHVGKRRASLVERWLEERGKVQALGQGSPLFCTLKGTPTDPSYARHLLPRLAKRAGLERRVHPHGLRHTHAADLALAGVPALAIQQQLGHRSLVTTANYLRRVGVRIDVAQAIRGQSPTGLVRERILKQTSLALVAEAAHRRGQMLKTND